MSFYKNINLYWTSHWKYTYRNRNRRNRNRIHPWLITLNEL